MIDSCLPRSFGGDVIRRPRVARVGGGAMSQRGVASGAAQPGIVSGELSSAHTETSTTSPANLRHPGFRGNFARRVELDGFNFRNRSDEISPLGFAQETMHWEQLLRLTNGKVSRFLN